MNKCILENMFICAFLGIIIFLMPFHLLAKDSELINSEYDSLSYSPNEILIQFKKNFTFDYQTWENFKKSGNIKLDSLNSIFRLSQVFPLSPEQLYFSFNKNHVKTDNIFLFRFHKKKSTQQILQPYQALKIVMNAEPNYYYFLGRQKKTNFLALDKIQMAKAAKFMRFERPVIIGIICSGINWSNKELISHIWQNPNEKADGKDNENNGFIDDIRGADFTTYDLPAISEKNALRDDDGFGTDLCTAIDYIVNYPAATKSESINKLMILKAAEISADNKILCNTFSVARAITYATDNNADIIHISAYSDYPSEILKHVIDYAKSENCTIIAAAGEKNSNAPVYPAAFKNVISVAATDFNDKKAENSNFGDWIDIAAPGYFNYQISDSNSVRLSETAIAAAQVSGLAAVLLSKENNINSDSLRKRIIFSSENIYNQNPQFSGKLGAGRINVYRTLMGKQQPNIIIQKLDFQNTEKNSIINRGDTIAVIFRLKNLSSTAKNVSVQLFSTDENIHFINAKDFVPILNYQAEYENKNNPLKLFIDSNMSSEEKPLLGLQIKTTNNFSFLNTYPIQIDSAYIKNMAFPIDPAKLQQSPIEYSLFPRADTSISVGDSIQFSFNLKNYTGDSLNYLWFLNDSIVSLATDSFFEYSPLSDLTKNDSIRVVVSNEDTVLIHHWTIYFQNKNRPPQILSRTMARDTTLALNDTMYYSVETFDPDNDSLIFTWTLNGIVDSSATDNFYVYFTDSILFQSDTLQLKISDADTLIQLDWIIHHSMKINHAPQIISATPPLDTLLTKIDSLIFTINCFDEEGDTLRFHWFRNQEIDSAATDSFYLYFNDNFRETIDSISVSVSDENTTIFTHWILFPDTVQAIQTIFKKTVAFYPETDSILAVGDSLKFNITNLPDSIKIQWFINSRIDSLANDPSFIYYPSNGGNGVDSIRVKIISPDSSFTYNWFIHYPDLPIQNDSLKIAFFPKNEKINISTSDSLKFSVKLKEGNLSNINIHWFVNHELDENNSDTTFFFIPDIFSTSFDTISALIIHSDTTLLHNWSIRYQTVVNLAPPVLLFPIEGNRITEFETLMWENDSSLTAIDSTTQWKYIVQLSDDSTFSEIFSTDTCSVLSLPLNKLQGFKKISIGTSVHWRVKLFSGQNGISEFIKSPLPFYYFPTFITLENFYGEKKEEGIFLYWTTSYELNCAGFNLFRSESPDGKFEKINEYLISGQKNYSFIDKTIKAGVTFYYKLEEITINSRQKFHQTIAIDLPVPAKFSLTHNFPNPFNSTTSFKYQIPKTTHVLIEVFNILGKKVKTLIDQRKDAGSYTVYWDGVDENGENVVSGIYFYIMAAEKFHATQKMIVVR